MMDKVITVPIVAVLLVGCGPAVDDEDDLPGTLVYEDPDTRIYRLDRRIDVVLQEGDRERRDCGFLTDRAHDELERTVDALDPSVDYGFNDDLVDCDPPDAWIHIEGFEHSPFECHWQCCRPELLWAAVVYSMVVNNFYGIHPIYDGEPYVTIEPDRPCP